MTIPPDLEAQIEQQASREGLSIESWLKKQVLSRELEQYAPPATSLQDELTPEEWIRQFHAWAQSHDRTTPLLSDEAISRKESRTARLDAV